MPTAGNPHQWISEIKWLIKTLLFKFCFLFFLQLQWLVIHTIYTRTHTPSDQSPFAETDTAGKPSMPTALRSSSHSISQHLLWLTAPFSLCLMVPDQTGMDALSCRNTDTHTNPLQKAHRKCKRWKWPYFDVFYAFTSVLQSFGRSNSTWSGCFLSLATPDSRIFHFTRSPWH